MSEAHRLLVDDDAREVCRQLGGSPDIPELDGAPDLRWPGYLGERFAPGRGVLMIANVHRNFASGSVTRAESAALVDATRRFKQSGGRADDGQTYLDRMRPVYEHGLEGGWNVSHWFGKALAAAGGVQINQTAYVNAARCQFYERKGRSRAEVVRDDKIKKRLQAYWLTRYPVSALALLLQPRLILCSSKPAFAELLAAGVIHSVPTFCFNQHRAQGVLTEPFAFRGVSFAAGTKPSEWIESIARLPIE